MADLITLDEYKEYENITSTKEDLTLENIIPSVNQLVKTYCGNSIVDYYSVEKEETFSVNWATKLLQLTESPANSISSILIRDSFTADYKTIEASEYYLDHSTDTVFRVNRDWPIGLGSVKISYFAGYESCPADLKLAVVDLITYYLRDEHKLRMSVVNSTLENPSSGRGRSDVSFPDHIKRVLDLYKTL